MNGFQDYTTDLLNFSVERLRDCRVPGEVLSRLEQLAAQVHQPCEVAVVGRVKAGKSTFINALLGSESELARVGATETTATINYFRYGEPDPRNPVRCYWRNGTVEDVSFEFLNSLQGNDVDTLRRADGIRHLEYRLKNPFLENVVLVDTPGLGAVVDEHQNRTAEYMQLASQLRQRHDQETKELNNTADAVIYLTDAVTRTSDRDFLEDFSFVTDSRSKALNAIGVVARIDQQPEVLKRRHDLAKKISHQLEEHLNTVVAVSGGLEFALHRLCANRRAKLKEMSSAFSKVPLKLLDKLLGSELLYTELDCQEISLEQREQFIDETIPWTVFGIIVRKLAVPHVDIDQVVAELTQIAGFQPLVEVLKRNFFERAAYLRCFKIISKARSILSLVEYEELPKYKSRDREELAQKDRFLEFLKNHSSSQPVAGELEDFVKTVCGVARRSDRLKSELAEISRRFAIFFRELEEHNLDFEALKLMEQHKELFSKVEQEELRPLFGHFGFDVKERIGLENYTSQFTGSREQHWRGVSVSQTNQVRSLIASRASTRYGLMLTQIR